MIYCLSCCALNDYKATTCSVCSASLELCPKYKMRKEIVLAGRYKLICRINSGGMGELFAALDLRLNSICAVKNLYLSSIEDEEKEYRLKRFKSEVEILAKLRHPSLPHMLDYFSEDEKYYLVMDYVAGHDLESILEKEGRPGLDEKRVVQWGITLCDVMEYLHTHKPQIIYRDLKPSNVMLQGKDKHLILIDFGTARIMEKHEKRQTAIGTMGYAPPEQYTGEQDARSDIYALGATLYHLVTGSIPIMPFEFPPIRKSNPDLSEKLETILIKALKSNVKERYQDIRDMKKDLTSLFSGEEKSLDMDLNQELTVKITVEKEEKWNLLGKIKRNILNSINKIKRELYMQKKITVFIIESSSTQILFYKNAIINCSDINLVDQASTPKEGLAKFEGFAEKPDIVLIDITMPETMELQLISKIKNINPSTKIILLSSDDIKRETVLNSFKAGATGYIQKKASQDHIRDAIRKAYSGGSPVEADIVTYLLDEFVNKPQPSAEAELLTFDGLDLEEVDLFELLIEFCSCEVTGKMAIKSPNKNGEIYVENGQIVHCVYGDITGEEAFYQTVNWTTGKARFYAKELPEVRTINRPADELLSEVITRKEQFAKIREKVKLDDIFKVHLATSAIITLQADNLYILSHLDEKKTIRDILKDTGKSYFEVAKAIYDLLACGVIKKVE